MALLFCGGLNARDRSAQFVGGVGEEPAGGPSRGGRRFWEGAALDTGQGEDPTDERDEVGDHERKAEERD